MTTMCHAGAILAHLLLGLRAASIQNFDGKKHEFRRTCLECKRIRRRNGHKRKGVKIENGGLDLKNARKEQKLGSSIHPLCEVVAGLKCSIDLSRVHAFVLGQILSIFPLEELHAVLGLWLTSEVAVGGSLLILGLAECKGDSNGTRAAIKFDLDDVCNIDCCQSSLLGAVGLDKEGKWFC